MLLLFIRHGETYANVSPPKDGEKPNPRRLSLTARGRKQVAAVAKHLKQYNPDVIYTSPLERAFDTAKEVKKYHPKARLRVREGLVEISGVITARKPGNPNTRTCKDQKAVAEKMFKEITRWKHKTAIVCTHGNLITFFITKFLEIPVRKGGQFRVDNTSVTALLYTPEKTRLITLNGRDHLPKALVQKGDPLYYDAHE